MDDSISRQAAIDVARKCRVIEVTPAHMLIDKAEVMTELMMLPSAQSVDKDINVPDNDPISRQTAIDEWKNDFKGYINALNMPKDDYNGIMEYINEMPSAQPEQPGWIPWDSGGFPEESGTYTVTAYDGATKRVTYAKYQKRLKRWELTGARAYWRVLAWMPLPEPYKGE